MNTQKYIPGMSFDQFLYANYGFSYTKEQSSKAFADYIRLSKNNKLTK